MGWIALLAAALYYHPWITGTLIGVTTTLICVIVKLRAPVPPLAPPNRQRQAGWHKRA